MVNLIHKLRFLFLFILTVIYCFSKAVDLAFPYIDFKDAFLLGLILASLLVISHKEHWLKYVLLAIVLIEFALTLLAYLYPERILDMVKMLIATAYFLLMAIACNYFTFKDRNINITTLFGSLSSYLYIGLFFSYLYLFLELANPASFSGLDSNMDASTIYFSFTTLTTLGFGDIFPTTSIAQTIVWFEAFVGQSYLAIIIGQLIGKYVAQHTRRKS